MIDSMDASRWTSFERLSQEARRDWRCIRAARDRACTTITRLHGDAFFQGMPPDTAFIVFGSLARREETEKSDIDWTMLVDGQADAQHVQFAHAIGRRLEDMGLCKPNPAGAFGKLSFSHELVHNVGGEQDTNRNTTQRVLLLLESCAPSDVKQVRQRVTEQLFKRYLEDDITYQSEQQEVRVPRFLLNDIVRFWRTMAVDFPAKQRDRNGKGWALRNFKLRMSRKLIFVSGLLTCMNARARPHLIKTPDDNDRRDTRWALQDYLARVTDTPPLEILADAVLAYGDPHRQDTFDRLVGMFTAYEEFLAILNDPDRRAFLDSLDRDGARSAPLFTQECRSIGNRFQDGLIALFFESNDVLTKTCQRYGVF